MSDVLRQESQWCDSEEMFMDGLEMFMGHLKDLNCFFVLFFFWEEVEV